MFPYVAATLTGDLGYTVYLLPYLEQDAMLKGMNLANDYNLGSANPAYMATLVPTYQCPSGTATESQSVAGKTLHYYANMGPKGTNPATSSFYAVYAGNPVQGPSPGRGRSPRTRGPG